MPMAAAALLAAVGPKGFLFARTYWVPFISLPVGVARDERLDMYVSHAVQAAPLVPVAAALVATAKDGGVRVCVRASAS